MADNKVLTDKEAIGLLTTRIETLEKWANMFQQAFVAADTAALMGLVGLKQNNLEIDLSKMDKDALKAMQQDIKGYMENEDFKKAGKGLKEETEEAAKKAEEAAFAQADKIVEETSKEIGAEGSEKTSESKKENSKKETGEEA